MRTVAIVGATGAVGRELIQLLERRNFPVKELRLFASKDSQGRMIPFRGEMTGVSGVNEDSFRGVDIVLCSAGSDVARKLAPIAVSHGAVFIDNSSAFRMDNKVPLVIPEINAEDIGWHSGIIANPNCTTAITLMALYPLHQQFYARRIFASSYQSVSGSGSKGKAELEFQLLQIAKNVPVERKLYPHQIAFNVIPQIGNFLDSGYTEEEMKMQDESRKIMHAAHFRASVTCVRVPVYRAHSIAVAAEFEDPVNLQVAQEILRKAPGLNYMDDPKNSVYPTPLSVSELERCAVGRLRIDNALHNGLSFWVSGDQLLKGAAQNAIQIAELLK